METNLDKWLESNNYFTRTKETPIPSNLLFTGYKGGKIYIPQAQNYQFLCKYAEELQKGTSLYYVECRSKVFKFMIDVDISDDHYWSKEEIIEITIIIQSVVKEFFEMNIPSICCTSAPKMKKDLIHTGIHLIWTDLFVTSDTALIMRRGIIQRLKSSSSRKPGNWDDIIDETIYTKNGYRMVGSDKMKLDKTNGKIPEGRPLELLFVMDSDGTVNEEYFRRLKIDTKSLVLETSIRNVISAYTIQGMDPVKIPTWLELDPLQSKAGSRTSKGNVVSSREHFYVENFIKRNLPPVYHGTVKSIVRYPKEDDYPPALLIKTTSKYCMNIGRDHNSCGIYFYATPTGITQRCLCTCNKMEGRRKGLCMDYVSVTYKFEQSDKEIRAVLFPTWQEDDIFMEDEPNKKGAYTHVPNSKNLERRKEARECDKLFDNIMKNV